MNGVDPERLARLRKEAKGSGHLIPGAHHSNVGAQLFVYAMLVVALAAIVWAIWTYVIPVLEGYSSNLNKGPQTEEVSLGQPKTNPQ